MVSQHSRRPRPASVSGVLALGLALLCAACAGKKVAPAPPLRVRFPDARYLVETRRSADSPEHAETLARRAIARRIESSVTAVESWRLHEWGDAEGGLQLSQDFVQALVDSTRFKHGALIRLVDSGRDAHAFHATAALERRRVDEALAAHRAPLRAELDQLMTRLRAQHQAGALSAFARTQRRTAPIFRRLAAIHAQRRAVSHGALPAVPGIVAEMVEAGRLAAELRATTLVRLRRVGPAPAARMLERAARQALADLDLGVGPSSPHPCAPSAAARSLVDLRIVADLELDYGPVGWLARLKARAEARICGAEGGHASSNLLGPEGVRGFDPSGEAAASDKAVSRAQSVAIGPALRRCLAPLVPLDDLVVAEQGK